MTIVSKSRTCPYWKVLKGDKTPNKSSTYLAQEVFRTANDAHFLKL